MTPSDWVGGSNALKVARAVSNGLLSENCMTPSDWVGDSGVFAGVALCIGLGRLWTKLFFPVCGLAPD